MSKLEAGQPARIVFRSDPDHPYPGKVVRLGRETDRETREFRVDVRPETLPDHWTIGQRAEVYIETDRKTNVTLVPAGFVVWRDGSAGVFTAVDGRSAWRELKLGLRGRDAFEVLDGLSPDEVVVRPAVDHPPLTAGRRIALP
jgi:multidrug efflux pump subunit AcrA (membrane-fusion protein)